MRTLAGLAAVSAIVVLIPALAWAGGEEYPDNGAQALSRGGAFTAKADDLTALQYNVAGLASTRGTRLLFSANIVNASATFTRSGTYQPVAGSPQPWDNQPYPTVSNQGGPFFAPMLILASDFGLKSFTFAGGIYGPSAYGGTKFPATVTIDGGLAPAPQRYDLIDEDLFVAYPTLAIAYRPLDMISVGAAFHWVYMQSKFHQATYLPPAGPPSENPTYDYDVNLDVSDAFSPSFSIGALARLTDHLAAGVNYRYATDMDASGQATAKGKPANPTQPMYDNGQFAVVDSFKTGLPQVLRAGLRYIWTTGSTEKADIEADFVYEGWNEKMQDIQIRTSHVTPVTQLIRSPHRFNDVYSVRLGGQYNWDTLLGVWSGRLGFYYDSAAAPPEWTRLDFRAWDHLGYTAGVGWQWGGITANLGGAYVVMFDRDVTNSQLRQTHSLGGSPIDPAYTVIGNGKWTGGYATVTFSLEYKFDPFR